MKSTNVSKRKTSLPGLKYLLENEYFITSHFLSSDRFIDFCKKRDISTSREQLEQYERLKLFYPLVRVKYFKFKVKVEDIGSGMQRELGILEDGEEWSGKVDEQISHFSFRKEIVDEYWEEGLLWEPSSRRFQSWKKFRDSIGKTIVESFYSIFQCHTLYLLNL